MGRTKTPLHGSQVAAPTPPARPVPASTVSNVEAQWFNPPVARMQPIGGDLEHRRGWRPPPASHGMGFVIATVLLLGVAGVGTFFFLGPDGQTRPARTPDPVSTTSITSADTPPAPSLDPTSAPALMRTITPADLPAVPPSVNAAKAPQNTPAPRAATPPPSAPAAKPPAKGVKSTGELPDLDRAAAAAGLPPSEEDVFSTPGTASENAPAATAPTPAPAPTAGSDEATPPPSEVAPNLEIKR